LGPDKIFEENLFKKAEKMPLFRQILAKNLDELKNITRKSSWSKNGVNRNIFGDQNFYP